MHDDLESIANLKYGEAIEGIARQGQDRLRAEIADLSRRGLVNSGQMVRARLNVAAETSEQTCHALYEIWLGLILQRNQNQLSRQDIDFIMAKVNACTRAKVAHIQQALAASGSPVPEWAKQQAQTKMQSVASGIGRDLEMKFREQEAFPKSQSAPDASFVAFLKAFTGSWLTAMSGPLTVPFAFLALILPGMYKVLFAILALTSGVYSAYQVWRRERLALASESKMSDSSRS